MKSKKNVVLIGVILIILTIGIIIGCMIYKDSKYGKITVEESGSTLNRWSYIILDTEIIKLSHVDSKANKISNQAGGTFEKTYYFEGLKQGKTTIKFINGQGSSDIWEMVSYEVSVDENLKVKISKGNIENTRNLKLFQIPVTEYCDFTIEDTGIIKYYGYEDASNKWASAQYDYCLVFEPRKKGTTKVVLNTKDGIQEYEVNVDKNLNVEIKKLD